MVNHRFIDQRAVEKALAAITAEREELKRRQATLRVQAHRLRKLLEAAKAAT